MKVFTNQKQFIHNPILRSKILNRLGLHVFRILMAYFCTTVRRFLLSFKIPKEDRVFFKRNGFIIKENFLPSEEYQALKKIIGELTDFNAITFDGDTKLQKISLTRVQRANNIKFQFKNNPRYINLLKYVASKNCPFSFTINKVVSGHYDPQTTYHTDTFHPTMKSWLYFNNISADEGPFAYFPGSHKLTLKRLILEYKISNDLYSGKFLQATGGSCRYTEENLKWLGLTEVKLFIVKENTLVIADTFGVHRRTPSKPNTERNSLNSYHRILWPFSILTGYKTEYFTDLSRRIYFSIFKY
ncbi:phytanoyl-CoA dioxygenase family protein [Legionella busanensis]|nr:phytanoyl-CoA dioxygenase family protein [Legionella busanensis]